MHCNDLRSLRATLETLLSPVDDVDTWRDAVCERIRALTGTDVVFFRLSDRGPSRIAPLGPLPARDAYRRDFRALDPWPRYRIRPGESRIDTHEGLIGPGRIRRDAYYNDFLRPYGVREYVGVQVGTTPGEHAHLGLFNSRESHRVRRPEETALKLRTIVPALQSGLGAWVAATRLDGGVDQLLDRLADPLFLCDRQGRVLEANAAMLRLLSNDAEERVLRQGLEHAARELVHARSGHASELLAASGSREVKTALGAYRVTTVSVATPLLPGAGALLMVRPPSRKRVSDAELEERYGLTPSETRVVRLLALGRGNDEICEALGLAPATARNHTARALRKLGIRSRAQVHPLLYP